MQFLSVQFHVRANSFIRCQHGYWRDSSEAYSAYSNWGRKGLHAIFGIRTTIDFGINP
jgi:hypothetical protein